MSQFTYRNPTNSCMSNPLQVSVNGSDICCISSVPFPHTPHMASAEGFPEGQGSIRTFITHLQRHSKQLNCGRLFTGSREQHRKKIQNIRSEVCTYLVCTRNRQSCTHTQNSLKYPLEHAKMIPYFDEGSTRLNTAREVRHEVSHFRLRAIIPLPKQALPLLRQGLTIVLHR